MKELEELIKDQTKNINWEVRSEVRKHNPESMVDRITVSIVTTYQDIKVNYEMYFYEDDPITEVANYIIHIVINLIAVKLFKTDTQEVDNQ